MSFYRLYRKGLLSEARKKELIQKINPVIRGLRDIETETVFCVEADGEIPENKWYVLNWLLRNPHNPKHLRLESSLERTNTFEIAPLLNFETADSTNAVSICNSSTLNQVRRLEQGRRYRFVMDGELAKQELDNILPIIRDQMTEGYYPDGLTSFETDKLPEPTKYIPVLEKGMEALIEANKEYGTSMDEQDLRYYHYLLTEVYKRNPTDTEFFYLGNAFSEHSRHHLFLAKIFINGKMMPFTLFELIKATLKNLDNSIIAFNDNGSAIKGTQLRKLLPKRSGFPSPARMVQLLYHYVLTCETHNHPCLIEAWNGAGTGGRGRTRDNSGTGRGGIIGAAISGFVGGNLLIPDDPMPWENPLWQYDPKVESPFSFFAKATEGDFYSANEHGEPLGLFFAESYGFQIGEERWENVKPIMFSGGMSFIDERHVAKRKPEKGMLIIRIGGKAFRVGLGGGSASSMLHGDNILELDWRSVQRVNGEMANIIDMAITDFVYMGDDNPIQSLEDQGAGGVSNNTLELIRKAGGKIYVKRFSLGDDTLSDLEILVCEYQESMAFLIKPEDWELVKHVCERRKCPCDLIGVVTDDGKVVIIGRDDKTVVADFELKHLFGEYPQKEFRDERIKLPVKPLVIPSDLTVREAMRLVPRLLGVTSREWLAHIVDRAVKTSLVQQMCVGPALLPINHYSITSPSNWGYSGQVNSVGHRPPVGFISAEACVRMTVADAMMGMMFAPISKRENIKASANWMLAAKLPGGLAWLYDAAVALKDVIEKVMVDINGGKDSLSLATKIKIDGIEQVIRSLNTLVFTLQADCPDFRYKITADIKRPGESELLFVDFAKGSTNLGGSAFAQVLGQTDDQAPDVWDPISFAKGFDAVQDLLKRRLILAGQKKVRGGLLQTISEMCYAAHCGYEVAFAHPGADVFYALFNEEMGAFLELLPKNTNQVADMLSEAGFGGHIHRIGSTTREKRMIAVYNGRVVLNEAMPKLRAEWRRTSYRMQEEHKTQVTVDAERRNHYDPVLPSVKLTFDPDRYPIVKHEYPDKPRIAVIEEEGTNSRDEMIDFMFAGGFEPWPFTLVDLVKGRVSLEWFRGLVLVPGFSFKDALGAGKGMAAVIKFNEAVKEQFDSFFQRPDTWSYLPCNAFQVVQYLGYILNFFDEQIMPLLTTNESEGFESRAPLVRIFKSPAIAFRGMEGSVIPIHIDHGQGRFYSPDQKVIQQILKRNLAPLRYTDMYGAPTEEYPLNPNGSTCGIAGIVDPTGRHFACMPHLERTHRKRHFHWWPPEWEKIMNAPWLRVTQNYRIFCEETEDLSVKPPREAYFGFRRI